ncbi:MAG: hypothetical protein RLY16_448 [Bacteroidota bacterium]|jgi:hypothetical protein
MKRFFSLLAVVALGLSATAQDASVKTMQAASTTTVSTDTSKKSKSGWSKGVSLGLNVTQIGNSNWVAAGGDKFSLSVAGSLNAFASRHWGRHTWDNVLDVNYAVINTTTLGVRKVNDRIDFTTKYGYKPKNWNKVSYTVIGQLRSQLASGFEYDYFGTTEKRRNSGFFAPAYIVVAPGVEWKPNSWFTLYGSLLAARWVIVSNGAYSYKSQGGIFNGNVETPLATLYGVNPAKGHRGEFGAFVTASVKKDLFTNVAYYSKLDLYSNYVKRATNVDIFWTNQFKVKLGKYFNISYTLDMLYDDDVVNPAKPSSPIGLQTLSTFGLGFAAKF